MMCYVETHGHVPMTVAPREKKTEEAQAKKTHGAAWVDRDGYADAWRGPSSFFQLRPRVIQIGMHWQLGICDLRQGPSFQRRST